MSGYGVLSRDEICPGYDLAANQRSLRDVDDSWIRNAGGGLVRSKNTTAILAKNITSYSVACIAFYHVGYNLMYGEGNALMGAGFALSGTSSESHSSLSDFFFQVVFVATAASIVSLSLIHI